MRVCGEWTKRELVFRSLDFVLQVTWGNKGATEEGSKLTKAKV